MKIFLLIFAGVLALGLPVGMLLTLCIPTRDYEA